MKNKSLLILFVFFSLSAQAAYLTGRDLAAACAAPAPKDVFTCLGYVQGVVDYHVMMQSLGTAPTTEFCLPNDVEADKAALIVMDYLKQSPQHADFIAAPAVVMALEKSFPCRKKK